MTSWQVKIFTDILLNIMSNFVPNEIKRIVPRDPPSINKPLKSYIKDMVTKKGTNPLKSYKRHGYKG